MSLENTVKYHEIFNDSELPIVVFHKCTNKLVELLSDVKTIKVIAADLVSSYEAQIETAAYRKVESLQRLKNQLTVGPSQFPSFRPEWDENFSHVLDELDDITTLVNAKCSVIKCIRKLIFKIKTSAQHSSSSIENETDQALNTFKFLVTSLFKRLMSHNFVRSLAIAMVEDRTPTSIEEAQKLYESVLNNLKWLVDELNLYNFTTVGRLSFDVLKRQTPKFNIDLLPKQPITSALSRESPQKHKYDMLTSPFINRISLEAHFRSCCIAGIPEGLNEVVLPVAAAYSTEYAHQIHELSLVPERGMILHGPPGTGKTIMAQAIASYFGCPDTSITITSGSNLLDKWVGSTEASIRDLFRPARKNQNQLYVIIIDEIDAILSTRQHAKNSWERTQVTQFLTELDGIKSPKNVFVIGITNFVEHLDSAAIRPGRLGSLIEVPLPNMEQRAQIFELHLSFINQSRLAISFKCLSKELAKLTEGFSGADICATVQRTANLVFLETIRTNHFIQNAVTNKSERTITTHDFSTVIEFIFKQKSRTNLIAPLDSSI